MQTTHYWYKFRFAIEKRPSITITIMLIEVVLSKYAHSLIYLHSLCIFVCGQVYIFVYVYPSMYACMHVCIAVFFYVCMYVCVHVCIFARMYVCLYVCSRLRMYGWMEGNQGG